MADSRESETALAEAREKVGLAMAAEAVANPPKYEPVPPLGGKPPCQASGCKDEQVRDGWCLWHFGHRPGTVVPFAETRERFAAAEKRLSLSEAHGSTLRDLEAKARVEADGHKRTADEYRSRAERLQGEVDRWKAETTANAAKRTEAITERDAAQRSAVSAESQREAFRATILMLGEKIERLEADPRLGPTPAPAAGRAAPRPDLRAERDALQAHYDRAGPEHDLLALLDLYHERAVRAEALLERARSFVGVSLPNDGLVDAYAYGRFLGAFTSVEAARAAANEAAHGGPTP